YSNIGVDHELGVRTGAEVTQFGNPEEHGRYESSFGATIGLPVAVGEGGEFDRRALLRKIDDYFSSPSVITSTGGNLIRIAGSAQDTFVTTNTHTNGDVLGAHQGKSAILLSGEYNVNGYVYFDGDVVIAGDVTLEGN